MTRSHHGQCPTSPPPSSPPPDDDDLLQEILLRLPPQPSSLPRASLVCKSWRRLLSDPHFLRRFRAHHRRPPLLGFFVNARGCDGPLFKSIMDPPDLIPPERFTWPFDDGDWDSRDCRHGRVLLVNRDNLPGRLQILVWDPLTGDRRCLPFPHQLDGEMKLSFQGAVVCAAGGDEGHVHGDCHSSSFKVVLVCTSIPRTFACVYSSEAGEWGNIIPTAIQSFVLGSGSILLGNSLYWMLYGYEIGVLEFDMERQSLDVIEVPSDICEQHDGLCLITQPEDSGLGLVVMSGSSAHIWKREADCDGVARWLPGQTIQLDKLLSLGSGAGADPPMVLGFAQDDNVIFVSTFHGVFIVHLESMQFKKVCKSIDVSDALPPYNLVYPYASFYAAGI